MEHSAISLIIIHYTQYNLKNIITNSKPFIVILYNQTNAYF